jgi:hypothetical protein
VHVLAALRPGACEHEAPDQPRADEGQLLGDEAAKRKAEQIDRGQLQRIEEPEGVVRHRGDRARRLARRGRHACVIEEDDLAVGGQQVDDCRVPVFEIAAIVLE